MRSKLMSILIAIIICGSLPALAAAHPLGNFSINRYSRLEVRAEGLRLLYILDLAEIPTFQEISASIDTDGDSRVSEAEGAVWAARKVEEIRRDLRLSVDGTPVPLDVESQVMKLADGEGGLKILRLTAWLTGPLPRQGHLYLRDDYQPDRPGWREIEVLAGEGVRLAGESVLTTDISRELTLYPDDMLTNPLDVREASVEYSLVAAPPGRGAVTFPVARGLEAIEVQGNAQTTLTGLIGRRELSLPMLALTLALALGLGAVHALSPGHGKTMVAAYLVGSRGTWRHAVFLGLTVTITHTSGVFALGLVTLYAQRFILPETLYPWLSLVSGLLVVSIGLSLAWSRLRRAFRVEGHAHSHDGHTHSHDAHDHHHYHGPDGHTHLPPTDSRVTWRGLLALGISGGLLPCPSALVVLLGAISLGRVGLGLTLILAFSLGLALVLMGIGLALVYAGRLVERVGVARPALKVLPTLSAVVITLVGLGITVQALAQVGLWQGPTVLAWLGG